MTVTVTGTGTGTGMTVVVMVAARSSALLAGEKMKKRGEVTERVEVVLSVSGGRVVGEPANENSEVETVGPMLEAWSCSEMTRSTVGLRVALPRAIHSQYGLRSDSTRIPLARSCVAKG